MMFVFIVCIVWVCFMELISSFLNGNVLVKLYSDGTRTMEYEDEMLLDYPLNIDIRLSNRCPLGFNERTNQISKTCAFCHESATVYGDLADLGALKDKLSELPKNSGIELAIGLNHLDMIGLAEFFEWCFDYGFVVNVTVNQMSVAGKNNAMLKQIMSWIDLGYIKGVGISLRDINKFHLIDKSIIEYENTVIHVIAGIDDFNDVLKLKKHQVKKLLILGEKEFGFNKLAYHNQENKNKRKQWSQNIQKFLGFHNPFEVVSFDNLALEQMRIKRFFLEKDWQTLNQNEHSFYINAVNQTLAPSSRSHYQVPMNNISLKDFFKQVVENPNKQDLKSSIAINPI